MGQEHQSHDAKGRRFPQNILGLVLLVIVSTNIAVLYVFSNRNCRCETPSIEVSQSVLAQILNSSSDLANEIVRLRMELKALHQGTERVIQDRTQTIWDELMARPATSCANGVATAATIDSDNPWVQWGNSQNMPLEFRKFTDLRKLPLGHSFTLERDTMMSPVGHGCALFKEELDKYMSYEVGKECPDDEYLTQKLLVGGCEPLPRRRCFSRIPFNYTEPFPLPAAYWDPPGDDKVIWTAYACKSFECLRNRVKERVFADCLDCFALDGREKTRWMSSGGELDYSVEEVVELKNGTLRIGLDLGGGTGTFAVRMKEHDVTIITSTLNFNGPFNNFVALRGIVPLFMTVAQRLPFFDNTLDIVHSMHVLSNWIPTDSLEFILYDIDRVLRPGGLFWLDHFFCVRSQLATYEPLIEKLGYKKLKYDVGEKVDRGRELQEIYISALLEKPMRRFSSQ